MIQSLESERNIQGRSVKPPEYVPGFPDTTRGISLPASAKSDFTELSPVERFPVLIDNPS